MNDSIILGDSHVACMKRALDAKHGLSKNTLEGTKVYSISYFVLDNTVTRDEAGEQVINPLIVQSLISAGAYDLVTKRFKKSNGRRIVFCFGGSESHMFGFKKFWTENTLYVGGGIEAYTMPVIPLRAVAGHFEHRLQSMFKAVRLITALWDGPVAFLGPPPPHRDNAKILAQFPQLGKLAEPAVRLEIYRVLMEQLQVGAEQSAVPYFDAHEVAAGDDHFLKAEYEGDGIHGNDNYGRAMLELIA